ncbi:hypothetical protein CR513_33821, partial [Mucuna pruriens]
MVLQVKTPQALKRISRGFSMMRPQGILEDYIKMKGFPFSLDGVAKDWLYLQPVLFNTWGDMKRMFLEKFFLESRTPTIRKEVCGIRQHSRKTLHKPECQAISAQVISAQAGNIPTSPALPVKPTSMTEISPKITPTRMHI